jgi:Domain of unknown function (DUF1841)
MQYGVAHDHGSGTPRELRRDDRQVLAFGVVLEVLRVQSRRDRSMTVGSRRAASPTSCRSGRPRSCAYAGSGEVSLALGVVLRSLDRRPLSTVPPQVATERRRSIHAERGRWDTRAVSPRSRGRRPGQGRPRVRGSAGTRRMSANRAPLSGLDAAPEVVTEWWFDEPIVGDRQSWAIPSGHGSYRDVELGLLDPADEDESMLLLEALHPDLVDLLDSGDEATVDGEPFSPRLHLAMHQIVANQLLADDPPETWQTVHRMAELGYDWHNVMHMIAAVMTEDVHRALTGKQPFDRADYAMRLSQLPGDWPPPE